MQSLLNVPAEVVSANINAAVAKAAAKKRRIFVLGIMAGAFIAMGAQSSSLAVHNITDVGIARTLAGCIFPVGLMMIVFVGGELFTGDCMMSMACMKGRIGFGSLLRTLLIVYLGNFAGAVLIAFLVAHSGQYDYSAGALGAYTIKNGSGKDWLKFYAGAVFRHFMQYPGVRSCVNGSGSKRYWRKSAGDLLPDPGLCSIWL